MALTALTIERLNTQGKDVLQQLSKYIVPFSWIHALCKPQSSTGKFDRDYDVRRETATAFLVASDKFGFLVTAGHRITCFNDTTAEPRQFIKAYVHTGLHSDSNSEALLFPLQDLPRCVIDRKILGLDYGAIVLDLNAVDIVTKNGNSPVFPGNWQDQIDEPDIHVMLGFPLENREPLRKTIGTVTHESLRLGTPLLPLEEVDDPETYSLDAPYDRFCARIVSREGTFEDQSIFLLDINGMSGGPIFALKFHQDSCDFQLIAVQSSCNGDGNIVAACYIKPFVEAVVEKLSQAVR